MWSPSQAQNAVAGLTDPNLNWDNRFATISNDLSGRTPEFFSAMTMDDQGQLYLTGSFLEEQKAPYLSLVSYDPETNKWKLISRNVPSIFSMVTIGRDLYVAGAGYFQIEENGAPIIANGIAKYNLDTEKWTALKNGISGVVYALNVYKGDLIVAGGFDQAGNISAKNIARYTPQTNTWTAMESNMNRADVVKSLAVRGDELYVGGVASTGVSKYDFISQKWTSLSGPMDDKSAANALTISNDHLYVGGDFKQIGGLAANGIVRYDLKEQKWASLGGTSLFKGVQALNVVNETLYIGGFLDLGNGKPNHIAQFDAEKNAFKTLGDGLDGPPSKIVALGKQLYISGIFNRAGTYASPGIAVWHLDSSRIPTTIEKQAEVPKSASIISAYPNPFKDTTTLQFALSKESLVKISIFDNLGREVTQTYETIKPAGVHEFKWMLPSLPLGVYAVVLETNGEREVRQVIKTY